jgi:biopolymer transport protein ExbD
MPIRNAEEKADLHVDFVPMVDVLFNLLIFFLLATSMAQAEREMSIALPRAVSSGPITTAAREIIINVDQEGRAIVAGKVVSDEELGAILRAAVQANAGQKVNVRGDRTTAYANVVRVLDLCKQAGIQQPYIETTPLR